VYLALSIADAGLSVLIDTLWWHSSFSDYEDL
jgi:hypothetical protein